MNVSFEPAWLLVTTLLLPVCAARVGTAERTDLGRDAAGVVVRADLIVVEGVVAAGLRYLNRVGIAELA